MTFEELCKANATIKTTDIKGKQYAEVPQRIKAFRMVYPEGTIKTELLSNEDGVCIFKAYAMDGDLILGTSTAYEKESSSFINKTSYIENCETSAVGRALGMAGFGIDVSVASYEEVSNAIKQQDDSAELGKKVKEVRKLIKSLGVTEEYVAHANKCTRLENMTAKQLDGVLDHPDKVKEKYLEAKKAGATA